MPMRDKKASQRVEYQSLDAMVSDILSGSVSLFDLLTSMPDDCFSFTQRTRQLHAVSGDLRVLKIFYGAVNRMMAEVGGISNDVKIEKGAGAERRPAPVSKTS